MSVHTTKIEIPTETDGVAALPEKNFPALYLHWHPELEFFYVEEGDVEFFIENHAFLLKKGDGIFVPPKLMHWARTKGTVLFHRITQNAFKNICILFAVDHGSMP